MIAVKSSNQKGFILLENVKHSSKIDKRMLLLQICSYTYSYYITHLKTSSYVCCLPLTLINDSRVRVLGLQNKITFPEGIICICRDVESQGETDFFSPKMDAIGLCTCTEFICESLFVFLTACVCVCRMCL